MKGLQRVGVMYQYQVRSNAIWINALIAICDFSLWGAHLKDAIPGQCVCMYCWRYLTEVFCPLLIHLNIYVALI